MEKRLLGMSNVEVSKICLGTMTRGYQNSEVEAHEQLDYAIDQGVNFIDTAEIYPIPPSSNDCGKTEIYIGNRLAKRGRRDDLVIASKIAGPNFGYIRDNSGFDPARIEEAVDASLARLQTDYIDLYQLHWPERPVPVWGKINYDEGMWQPGNAHAERIEAVLTVLQQLQQAGKVRYFGLSNETPWGAMKFLEIAKDKGLPRMQSIQNAYNLLRREYEIGLAEISMQEQIGLLAYSPLAGGMLTGKYADGAEPAGSRYATWGKQRMAYYARERSQAMVDDLILLAQEVGVSVAQLSLAWVTQRKFVTSNIIGATSMEQLREDIASANVLLSDDVLAKIDDLWRQNPNPACW